MASDRSTVTRALTCLFSLLVILLALACIGMIIYGYTHIHKVWNTLGSFGLIAFILLLCAVAIIVVVGLMGLCGALCRSRCCLIFFAILILVLACVMVAIGVLAIILPPDYFSTEDDSKCLKIGAFGKLQGFSEEAQRSVCAVCGCYFPNSENKEVYTPEEITRLKTTDAPRLSLTNSSLPTRNQQCSNWTTPSFKAGPTLYQYFQTSLKCVGWCSNTSSLYYKFTDVNNGKPQYTCYARTSHYIRRYCTVLAVIAFVMAGLMMVGFLAAVGYLCGRKSLGGELVEGMPTTQNIILPEPRNIEKL